MTETFDETQSLREANSLYGVDRFHTAEIDFISRSSSSKNVPIEKLRCKCARDCWSNVSVKDVRCLREQYNKMTLLDQDWMFMGLISLRVSCPKAKVRTSGTRKTKEYVASYWMPTYDGKRVQVRYLY